MTHMAGVDFMPREPSRKMMEAGKKAYEPMPTSISPEIVVKVIYQAMFDAEAKRLRETQYGPAEPRT